MNQAKKKMIKRREWMVKETNQWWIRRHEKTTTTRKKERKEMSKYANKTKPKAKRAEIYYKNIIEQNTKYKTENVI